MTAGSVRITARTGPGATGFVAYLNSRNITGRFARSGGQRVVVLRRGGPLQTGGNNLAVMVRGAGGRTTWVFRHFVLARVQPTGVSVPRFAGAVGAAPMQVTLNTTAYALPTLRATLNGRQITGAFGPTSPRQTAMLGASDGVRFGRNTLRLVIYDDDGSYGIQTRTFTVPRTRPLAGAGPNRTALAGTTIQLNGSSSRAAQGGKLSYRWQVVSRPRGARVTLLRAGTVRPSVRTDRNGLYVVRLTVTERRGRRTSQKQDLVTLDALPSPFPTTGVPITTLDSQGRMVINGAVVPSTGGAGKISLVVIRRSDRQILSSSNSYDPSKAGIDRLQSAVGKVLDGEGEKDLVLITGTAGVSSAALDEFSSLVGQLGAKLAPDDRAGLTAGRRFSIIGIPFSAKGAAFTSVDRAERNPRLCQDYTLEGELTGYLQLQYSTVPATYGFVFGQYPHFDTSVSRTANSNTMSVNGVTYRATLTGGTAGFHIVALERRTLQPMQLPTGDPLDPCSDVNYAVGVNTGDLTKDTNEQNYVGSLLHELIDRQAIVLIQTIGTPKPTTAAWTKISDSIYELGGNRAIFNDIATGSPDAGKGVYAIVGATGMDVSVAETSQVMTGRPGVLTGLLERSNRAIYQPFLADDVAGSFNQKLIDIAYQTPRAFQPAFTTAGEQAADRYLSTYIHLTPGDVRQDFVIDFGSANWAQAATDLDASQYPGSGVDFSAADFAMVKSALHDDLSQFNRVREYMTKVARPLTDSKVDIFVNLQAIGTEINTAIAPPPQDLATARAFGILSSIVGVGGSLPEVGPVVTAFSSVLSLASKYASPDGSQIGGDITTQVADLGDKLVKRLNAASRGFTGLTLLIVGDGGKLSDMAARLNDNDWKLPNDAPAQAAEAIRKGAARWFYSSLLPHAYQLYQLRGVARANDYECHVNGYQKVFIQEPPNGQQTQTVGFAGNPLRPVQESLALGRDIRWDGAQPFARTPPTTLIDPLFQPADKPNQYPKGLALYKPQFLSRANFPIASAPDNRADCA